MKAPSRKRRGFFITPHVSVEQAQSAAGGYKSQQYHPLSTFLTGEKKTPSGKPEGPEKRTPSGLPEGVWLY